MMYSIPNVQYVTITDLRRHLDKYFKASQDVDLIITRFGHPIFVLIRIDRWIDLYSELYEEIRSNQSDLDKSV